MVILFSVIYVKQLLNFLKINMLELEEKLYDLVKWVAETYGISKKEAIASIINKVEKL